MAVAFANKAIDAAIVIPPFVWAFEEQNIAVKFGEEELSPALRYYNDRLHPVRATQIVATLDKPYDRDGIRVTNPFLYFDGNAPWSS